MLKRVLLLAIVALSSLFGEQTARAQSTADVNAAADSAYEALIKNFWEPARGNFAGEGNYWFYAHSIDIATLAFARTGSEKNLKRIEILYAQQARRGYLQGTSVYYDDENWMALSLARASELTGRKDYLKTALELFNDVRSGERFDSSGQTLGIWWSSQKTGSSVASTVGSIITACLFSRLTQEPSALPFAVRNYAYWRDEMTDRETGLVYDFRKADGAREKGSYTYGQGLMVGAALELFRLTKQPEYLNDARTYARYILNGMNHNGVLTETFCEKNWKQCLQNRDVAQFKGIAIRYLVELAKEDPQNLELRLFLDTSIQSLLNAKTRNATSGRFAFDWEGKDSAALGSYPATNSAALALAAYATL